MRLVVLAGTGGGSRSRLDRLGYKGNLLEKPVPPINLKICGLLVQHQPMQEHCGLVLTYQQQCRISSSDVAAPLWGWWMRELHNIPYEKIDAVFGDIPIK